MALRMCMELPGVFLCHYTSCGIFIGNLFTAKCEHISAISVLLLRMLVSLFLLKAWVV